MINFKTLKYKNILSTGNKYNVIDLTAAKTNILQGSNGSGKSSLLDALSFVLFEFYN